TGFLVMELLHGASLAEVLACFGPGRPEQVADMLRQMGSALQALHRLGLVHRDVKPENIFLCPRPDKTGTYAKLLDFGIAKQVRSAERLTRTGQLMGTPHYMSPEQVRGQLLDERSDVYSLACVAYEALSGQRLVSAAELAQVFQQILSAE